MQNTAVTEPIDIEFLLGMEFHDFLQWQVYHTR
jgi:hypothetical protein